MPDNDTIVLPRPVAGSFLSQAVVVLELGSETLAIGLETCHPAGSIGALRFRWRDTTVDVDCRVVNCVPESESEKGAAGVHASFIAEVSALSPSKLLAGLIREHWADVERAQEANAMGDRKANLIDGDATLTGFSKGQRKKSVGFITYQFAAGSWKKTLSLLAQQPADGFTLVATEDPLEVDKLRAAYESAGPDERELIREMAAASIPTGR